MSAGCAPIAYARLIGEQGFNQTKELFVALDLIKRDLVEVLIRQLKLAEVQVVGLVEEVGCCEVAILAVEGDLVVVCVHVFNLAGIE